MGHYDDAYEEMYKAQYVERQKIKNSIVPVMLDHLNRARTLIRQEPSIFNFSHTRLEQDLTILIKIIESELK